MVPVSPSRSKACPDQLSLIALTVTRCRSSAALHSSPVTYRPAMMRSVCNRGTRASQRSTMVSSGLSLTITDKSDQRSQTRLRAPIHFLIWPDSRSGPCDCQGEGQRQDEGPAGTSGDPSTLLDKGHMQRRGQKTRATEVE